MIVRNEAQHLPALLDRMREGADEMVVVDTGSTDGTVAVAEAHGARVFSFEWCDDFSAARNFAIDQCQHEWILALDADEMLSHEDVRKLRGLVKGEANVACVFETRNYTDVSENTGWVRLGEDDPDARGFTGYFPSRKVRLFPNVGGVRFRGPVHELVEPSLRELGIGIEEADVIVHHYGKEADAARMAEKRELYRRLAEKKLQDAPEDVRALLEAGRQALEDGEPNMAEERLKAASLLEPKSADVRYWLGLAYHHQRKLGPARVQYELATRLDPGKVDAWNNLGNVLRAKKDFRGAEAALRKALEVAPGHFNATTNLGVLFSELGDWPKTVEAFRRALAINPSHTQVRCNLAVALRRQEKLEEAAEECRMALGVDPKHGQARALLAEIESESGAEGDRPTLALCMIVKNEASNLREGIAPIRSSFDEAVIVDTGSDDDTVVVAQELGAKVASFEWCDDFSAARNVSLSQATADWILWLDGDDRVEPDALVQLRQSLPRRPSQAFALRLEVTGDSPVSCMQVRVVPNLPGIQFEGRVHEQLAYSVERLGLPIVPLDVAIVHEGYEDADTLVAKKRRNHGLLLKQLEEHPDDVLTRFYLIRSHQDLGEDEAAIACAQGVIEQDPPCGADRDLWLFSHVVLGELHEQRDETEAALRVYRKALAADADYTPAKFRLGICLVSLRDFDGAFPHLTDALRKGIPDSKIPMPVDMMRVTAYTAIGVCAESKGDATQAETCYRAALDIDPNCVDACVRLARLRTQTGARGEALALYRKAEQVDPRNAEVQLGLGNIHFGLGDYDAAETRYEQAVRCAPGDGPHAYFSLGNVAYRKGDVATAADRYQKAIDLGLCDAFVHSHLARAFAQLGQWDRALAEYASCLDTDPECKEQVVEGLSLALDADQYRVALELCESLIRHGEQTPTMFCVLGDCYLKTGSGAAAHSAYKAALSLDGSFAPAQERMAALQGAIQAGAGG